MSAMSCHMPCTQRVGRTRLARANTNVKTIFKCARPVRDARMLALKLGNDAPSSGHSSSGSVVAVVLGFAAAFITGDAIAQGTLVASTSPSMSVLDLYYGSSQPETPVAAPPPQVVDAPKVAAVAATVSEGSLSPAVAGVAVAIGVGAALAAQSTKKEKVETAAPQKVGTQKVKAGTQKLAVKAPLVKAGTAKIAVKSAGTAKIGVKAAGGTTKLAVKGGTSKVAAKGTIIKGPPAKAGTTKVAVAAKVQATKQAPPAKAGTRFSKAPPAKEPAASSSKGSNDVVGTAALLAIFGVTLAVSGSLLTGTGSSSSVKAPPPAASKVDLEELLASPSSKPSTPPPPPVVVAAVSAPAPRSIPPPPAPVVKAPTPAPPAPQATAVVPEPTRVAAVTAAAPAVVSAPTPAPAAPAAVSAPAPARAVAAAPAPAPAAKPTAATLAPPAPKPAPTPAPVAAAPVAETAEAPSESSKAPVGTILAVVAAIGSAVAIAYAYKEKTAELFKPLAAKDSANPTLLRTPRPRDLPMPSSTPSVDPPAPGATSTDVAKENAKEVALSEVYTRLLENPTFQEMLSASLAKAGVPFNPQELKKLLIEDPSFKAKLQAVANALPEEKQAALKELQSQEKITELESILSDALTTSK